MSKKKRVIIFIAIVVVVLLCLVLRVFVRKSYSSTYRTPTDAVSAADWMKEVDDAKSVNQINIPGSHDCAANYVQYPLFAQCQYLTITQQLERGSRYLDVRLAVDEGQKLRLVHSFANCKTQSGIGADKFYFDALLKECYDFLEAHPSETIIMCTKQDYGEEPVTEFQKLLYSYINENSSYWYLTDEVPELGQVRGKIILARRFDNEAGYAGDKCGLDLSWEDMPGAFEQSEASYHEEQLTSGATLYVQDHYEYTTQEKITAVEDTWKKLQPDEPYKNEAILLNFWSTKGTNGALGTPYKAASVVNAHFRGNDITNDQWLGWVIMDFVDEELARTVFESNL